MDICIVRINLEKLLVLRFYGEKNYEYKIFSIHKVLLVREPESFWQETR